MAVTWGQLLTKIASRHNRDDLDAAIREIAEERVQYFSDQVFFASSFTDQSLVTNPGQRFYDLPSGWEGVNSVRVLQGTLTTGIWIELHWAPYDFINSMDNLEPPVRSLPAWWSLYGSPFTPGQSSRAIRMFPTPGAVQTIELTMDHAPTVPADNASNFWTQDCQNLILYSTCAEVCRVHVSNPIRKVEFEEAEARERRNMEGKSIRARNGIQIKSYL